MAHERRPQVVAVEALGTAWTVYSLYPDPETQPAFRRAVESLRDVVSVDTVIDIEGQHFLSEGFEIETDREGSERLARRCYVHHIESIRFENSPTELDVAKLFASLSKEEDAVRASGGIAAALRRDGVGSMSIIQRTQLRTIEADEIIDRQDRVQRVIESGADPKQFAEALMEQAGEIRSGWPRYSWRSTKRLSILSAKTIIKVGRKWSRLLSKRSSTFPNQPTYWYLPGSSIARTLRENGPFLTSLPVTN